MGLSYRIKGARCFAMVECSLDIVTGCILILSEEDFATVVNRDENTFLTDNPLSDSPNLMGIMEPTKKCFKNLFSRATNV